MGQEILVLGDSHTQVFTNKLFIESFPEFHFSIVGVDGATLSGLTNPNSQTQALPIFKHVVQGSTACGIITLLGEVDTGFVIWYRAERDEVDVNLVMEQAIQNYIKLLKELSEELTVICISTPLPTIQDGNNWGTVANLRKSIKASQRERTQLTLAFNKKVQDYCRLNSILYLMLDGESLGEDGFVSKDLLNTNPIDHHYDREKYAALIIKHLKEYLIKWRE